MTSSLRDFAARARTAGLFMDFDGTLSPIVPRPEAARPLAGIPEMLSALAQQLALVAVVSGRSAHQLAEWLGPHVEIWGLHGAERAVGGRVELTEAVAPFLDAVKAARDEASGRFTDHGLAGAIVEDKGAMLGLHYRNAPDPAAVAPRVEQIAHDLAERHGLTVVPGRMVFELRPPVRLTKRDVVDQRGRELGLTALAFIGDDTVDLPGYDALDRFAEEGAVCLRVAVRSDEAPAALLERADMIVDGPAGVLELLGDIERLTTGA